jgi:hypothetical protein
MPAHPSRSLPAWRPCRLMQSTFRN